MSARRLLDGVTAGRSLSLAMHTAVHGRLGVDGEGVIAAVERAGLRGRGGAAFPTATKLLAVAHERGPHAVVVNAAEGEPMSAKDAVLLRLAPHLVLDGAQAAARSVDASQIVVAIRDTAPAALAATRRAAGERFLEVPVTVTAVPAGYLAGEESALVRYLSGGPLKPTVVPPRPAQRGLDRRPTLVDNPETLAHLALIARHGADWFRQIGTATHTGSALVTVSGAVARPGVQEIAIGTPLVDVLAAAGGPTEPLRALLVGGLHGAWLPDAAIASVTLDDEGLRPYGATLGTGVIVALGASACPASEIARTMRWYVGQNAGQCGPCQHGLPAIAGLVEAMIAGTEPADADARLARWTADVTGRGACRLPDGAMRFLTSGLAVFAAEIADHRRYGPCDACATPPTLLLDRDPRSVAA